MSRKRCRIEGKLLLSTNRKSYISFRLVPNSVTLNDLEWRNSRYFALFQRIPVVSGAHCKFTFAISSPDEFLSLQGTLFLLLHHAKSTCCGCVNYAMSLLCSGQVSLSYKLVVISLIVWRVRNMATSSSRPHADCMLVQLTASVTSLGYWTPRVWSQQQQQQQRQTSPSSTIQVSYSRYARPVRNYEYQCGLTVLSFIWNTACGATVTFTDV